MIPKTSRPIRRSLFFTGLVIELIGVVLTVIFLVHPGSANQNIQMALLGLAFLCTGLALISGSTLYAPSQKDWVIFFRFQRRLGIFVLSVFAAVTVWVMYFMFHSLNAVDYGLIGTATAFCVVFVLVKTRKKKLQESAEA